MKPADPTTISILPGSKRTDDYPAHLRPKSRFLALLVGGVALSPLSPALADFSGSDSLASKSANWAELFPGSDRDLLVFKNARLEYHKSDNSSTDNSYKWAYLKWTPNHGSYDEDWFVQVHVHHAGPENSNIGIGVLNTANREKGYVISINRGSDDGRGFMIRTISGLSMQYSLNSATDGFLRIHFNSKAKTLTGSWKSRVDWHQFPPIQIDPWNMNDSSSFTAVLIGSQTYYDEDINPSGSASASSSDSGKAYFSDFRCGLAVPDIDVEQPAFSDLTDGVSKKGFGTATVGGNGTTRTFTIRNQGTNELRDLRILSDGTNAAEFNIADLATKSLKPGASTTFRVTFKPNGVGTRKAAIHIASNDPNENPFDIFVSGHGVN